MAYDSDLLGSPNTQVGIRKRREQRFKGMRATRSGQEPTWMEIARFCAPTMSRFLDGWSKAVNTPNASIAAADKINAKLYDARAVWASEVLGNGMYSGLQAPSRPWFKLVVGSPEAREQQSVKVWTDIVEKRLYELFSSTNFYTATKNGYQELGLYGQEAGLMERHWREGLVCHPLTVGEYWFGLDETGQVSSLYRCLHMSAQQHYDRFLRGREPGLTMPKRVVEAYDKGDVDQTFPVYHAIEPGNVGLYEGDRRTYSSVYWSGVCEDVEKNYEAKALLANEGFRAKPFWSPRWVVRSSSEVYASTSPGLNALADVRQLQMETLRKQQAMDFMVKPALAGPSTLLNAHAALQPGRVTAQAQVDKTSFFPIWEVHPSAVTALSESKREVAEAVDRSFYVPLFQAITNMQGVQPRNEEEIARRYEEQLTQLGPVVERVNKEKLEPAIARGYEILAASGVLPPPPEELDGEIKVEFISVLASAQKRIGLGGIEQTFGFASSVAQGTGDMSIMDNLDADKAIQEYGDITGIDAKILRPKEEVEAIRNARAQAQQQQQQAEQMAALAPAAKQGVEAAALLYDTPSLRDAMGV